MARRSERSIPFKYVSERDTFADTPAIKLGGKMVLDLAEASIKDIDLSLQLGAGHPMGPLHLSDYIGLDTCLYIVQGWTEK